MNDKIFQIRISVVIPAYNREKTIRSCIESVLTQTYAPFEVVVVDDCSSDTTVDIVKSIADERVRCYTLEYNSGAQAARNYGIRQAQGDWIAFQDSDDLWCPEKLERQIQCLADNKLSPYTVIHTSAYLHNVDTGEMKIMTLPIVDGDNVYKQLLTVPGPLFPTLLVSKEALARISYLDEAVPSYQEWDTSIRLAKFCKFVFINQPLFIYNLHEGETISKNPKREIAGFGFILRKFEEDIKKFCGTSIWETHLLTQLIKCMNNRLWEEADRYWAEVVRLRPAPKLYILKLFILLRIRPNLVQKIKTAKQLLGDKR